MKKYLRIVSVLLAFVILMSLSALTAFAEEPEGYADNAEIIRGDTDGSGDITVKDATTIQKYLAKFMEFDEATAFCADVNSSGDITISDATLVQKFVAHIVTSFPSEEPESLPKIQMDVEFSYDTAYGTDFTVEEAGLYKVTATPVKDCSLSFLMYGSKDNEMWHSQSDGEAAYSYALFEEGEYHIAFYPEDNCDVKASVVIEKTNESLFDMDSAKRIKLGSKEELKADGSVKVYKFNINSLSEEGDTAYIYTEGENTRANITVYSDVYAVLSTSETLEDGNVEAFLFDDEMNSFCYIVVECFEDGENFTFHCESAMEFSESLVDVVTFDTAYEVEVQNLADESADSDTEAVYVGEYICEFVAEESGFYSITYTSDELSMVNHSILDNYYSSNPGLFFFKEADGNTVKDVRYFEAGVSYYIVFVANLESDSEPLFFEINLSTEEEYNRIRQEEGEFVL